MSSRRTRYAFLMMVLIASICTTAKMTSDAVRNEYLKNETVVETAADRPEQDAVSQFRTERQQLRQMQKSLLNDIIYNPESDGEMIYAAQHKLLEIIDTEQMETNLEGLLNLRGFDDVVSVINGDSVNILLGSEVITSQETAVILDLITCEFEISAGNVKIIPIK